MTSTRPYDPTSEGPALPEPPPLPTGALVCGLLDLLRDAADLVQPCFITIHEAQQAIGLQFTPEPSSLKGLVRWATRFGAVITTEPCECEHGENWCVARFDYYGVTVTAYAQILAATAST